MKCKSCQSDYPQPDIIDGIAYFVCSKCGHVQEEKDYHVYTKAERIEIFEKEYGVKLPEEYVNYIGTKKSWVVKLPPCSSETTQYYFGAGFYAIGEFSDLNPEEDSSIFHSASLVETWGLPEKLILIDGDGHTWLALDYRESAKNPKVIVIESNTSNSLVVAHSFQAFVQSLFPYESVYDIEGNFIHNGFIT